MSNPVPGHQEFAKSPLDDLDNDEVADLLNKVAKAKRKRGGFREAVEGRPNEVDLSHVPGLEGVGVWTGSRESGGWS
jgi:hypothetical protein